MEKRTPHCQLSIVKRLIDEGKVRSTYSALTGTAALGLDFNAMIAVISALSPLDFYKSMTTHTDHRIWQERLPAYHSSWSSLSETDRRQ